MIEPQSEFKTDVLKEKARQIKGLLENCNSLLSISPAFVKVGTQIGKAWALAHFLAIDTYPTHEIPKQWKKLSKLIVRAVQELHKQEKYCYYAAWFDVEALLCDAWETCLDSAPSPTLKAPEFTQEGYLKAFPHCWDKSQFDGTKATYIEDGIEYVTDTFCDACLKVTCDCVAESPAQRPEPLPVGTQVIMNIGVFAAWNNQKVIIQSFEDMGDGAVIYLVKARDGSHAMVMSSNFEVDQAWAIENEENALSEGDESWGLSPEQLEAQLHNADDFEHPFVETDGQ